MLCGSEEDRGRNELISYAQSQEGFYALELSLVGIVGLIGHIEIA